MNRSARRIARKPRQVQRLGDDALAGERGVAMNENRDGDGAVEVRGAALPGARPGGARHADRDRIDRLEMARVRRHRDVHVPARSGGAGARVILHVAHPSEVGAERLRGDRVLEFREDLRVRLVEDVREHVEPSAVRHREHAVARAVVGRAADDLVEDRHEHVEPLEREARLAGKRALQEPLEHLDLRDAIEDRFDAVRVHRRQEAPGLGRLAQPHPLLGDEHVRVVEAGRRTVDAAQPLDGLEGVGGRLGGGAIDQGCRQLPQVVVADPVRRGRKRGIAYGR